MLIRLLVLALIVTACQSGRIACPEVKGVKLNRRPINYQTRMHSRSLSALREDKAKADHYRDLVHRQSRSAKSAASIEEWDCPKPGTKTAVPKAVRENIKRNRKKFDSYYKNRSYPDSVTVSSLKH